MTTVFESEQNRLNSFGLSYVITDYKFTFKDFLNLNYMIHAKDIRITISVIPTSSSVVDHFVFGSNILLIIALY